MTIEDIVRLIPESAHTKREPDKQMCRKNSYTCIGKKVPLLPALREPHTFASMLIKKIDLRISLLFQKRGELRHLTPEMLIEELQGSARHSTLKAVPVTIEHLLNMGFYRKDNEVVAEYDDEEIFVEFRYILNAKGTITRFELNDLPLPAPKYLHHIQGLCWEVTRKIMYYRGVL